ncbi:MAG: type III-B CRISPR module-associated Cmr3 family protein [Pseudomonadota bacterium]
MSLHYRFLEPLDVLFLRGNKLFGDPGSYGEALIPPWPSVAAGALRSRMMADDATLSAEALQKPDNFRLATFHLARRVNGGVQTLHPLPADPAWISPDNGRRCGIETLHPMPADLVVTERDGEPECVCALNPQAMAVGLLSSASLPRLPVLRQTERGKPAGGYWLNAEGWACYLQGQTPQLDHLVKAKDLWTLDTRVGVGLDTATRRADDGKLFSMQAIAFKPEFEKDGKRIRQQVGFLVGASAAQLPESGTLRFGGDGRAVAVTSIQEPYALRTYEQPAAEGRFKLALTTPGIFEGGWRLPGLDDDNIWHGPDGCTAKLVCAAVGRAETVSGWDLAQWQPKPAQKAAPAGSVYWFEDFQGDAAALGKLVETGLWDLRGQNDDPQRKAEGFNNVAIGLWQ